MEAWRLKTEARRLKTSGRRLLQHFDKEHRIEVKSRIRIRIGIEMKSWISISIKVMRIHNTVRKNATSNSSLKYYIQLTW
jgi:hypothetical protein